MNEEPQDILELTKLLIKIRKKPTTLELRKQYPKMLQTLQQLIPETDDSDTLKQVIRLDSGFWLIASIRQQILERLLDLGETTPFVLQNYRMQLDMYGYMNADGRIEYDNEERIAAIEKLLTAS